MYTYIVLTACSKFYMYNVLLYLIVPINGNVGTFLCTVHYVLCVCTSHMCVYYLSINVFADVTMSCLSDSLPSPNYVKMIRTESMNGWLAQPLINRHEELFLGYNIHGLMGKRG